MQSLIVALALLTATSATAAEVTATRLDGTTIVGELSGWDDQALSIASKDGAVPLAATELLSLRWSATDLAGASEKSVLQPAVELVDGTTLPIDDFIGKPRLAMASLRGNMPSTLKNVKLQDRSVAAVRLQPLQGEAAKQWQEIRNQEFPSDVLVLLKRGGQSLDYIEGTITDVTADKVEFKIEDDVRHVDRSKFAGLIFYRAGRPSDVEPLCVLHGRDGLQASVAKISHAKGLVNVTTVADTKLTLLLDDVLSADFSAGKVVFLSDAEPATEEQTPLVGTPAGVALAAEYGRPRRDKSAFGGPLTLSYPSADSTAPVGRTKSYSRGLAVRSRTMLVYRVPKGFTKLLGIAGIEPATRGEGSARLVISGDEKPLFNAELGGNQSPQELEVDITGVKRLKIVVDYGQNLDTGDWVNLCDVRLVK